MTSKDFSEKNKEYKINEKEGVSFKKMAFRAALFITMGLLLYSGEYQEISNQTLQRSQPVGNLDDVELTRRANPNEQLVELLRKLSKLKNS